MSQISPVPVDSSRGRRPTASRRRAARAGVCRSAFPSSGGAWRWRRRGISGGAGHLDQSVNDAGCGAPRGNTLTLADVTPTTLHDRERVAQLVAAAKPAGDRRQLVDELLDRLPGGRERPLVVEDDLGVEPVPGGPPLVLADDPAPRDRQRVA